MGQKQIGIIQSINGKYIAVDKDGKVRILKKGDIVYDGEELRYEGEVQEDSSGGETVLKEDGTFEDILDSSDPYLIVEHLETGDTYLLTHTGYLYLSTDISGDNSTSSSTTTIQHTTSDNENPANMGGRSYASELFGIPVEKIVRDGSFTFNEELAPLQMIDKKLDTSQKESIRDIQVQEAPYTSTEETIKDSNKEKENEAVATKPNNTPTIEDGDFTGKVKELPDNDPNENNTKVTTNGKIQFNDLDTTDTHTVSSTPKETNYKGDFSAKVENGEIIWDFSVDDKDLDTLKEGETLTQTYTITLDDGNGGTITKDVTISLEGTNDAPIAKPDTATTNEDTPATGNVLDNDSDIDGDTLLVTKVNGTPITSPITTKYGTIVMNEDGSYTFTPDSTNSEIKALDKTQSLNDTITYTVEDGMGGVVTQTLTITITGKNDTPAIESGDVTGAVTELPDNDPNENNTKHQANGRLQFSDLDATDTHTVSSTPKETTYRGEFTAKVENGEIVWNFSVDDKDLDTLKEGETLTQTYTVTLDDGHGGTISKDVTITLKGANDAPVANSDTITTNEDTPATGNVLDNDSDVDGDTLSVKSAKVDINGDGTKESLTLGSSVILTNTSGKVVGTFQLNSDGSYVFNPAPDYDGDVPQVDYTISDGITQSSSTLDITITPIPEPPTANKDIKTTVEDTPLNGNVLSNDTDPDGNDTLHVKSATVDINGDGNEQSLPIGTATALTKNGVAIGTITLNADGTFNFTPATNYDGEVPTINYTIEDSTGKTSSSTLTINIDSVNDAPVAHPDSRTVIEDTRTTGNILANDTDPDGDTLHVKSAKVDINGDGVKEDITIGTPIAITNANGDAIGIFKLDPDGSYTFDPAPNYTGSIPVIDYTATDGEFDTSSTLTLNIKSVNDAPVANPDTTTVNEDTVATGNVLTNDTDIENDTLHVKSATVDINGDGNEQPLPIGTKTTLAKNGKPIGDITLNADGTYTFDPAPDYSDGVPQITYVASDGDNDATSTLDITINPTNDGVTITGLNQDATPEHTVNEANLSNGSSPNAQALSKTGTFSFTSVDGLGTLSIDGNNFTLANLQAFNGTQSIATDFGTLTFNSFTGDKQGGTINYTYTLTQTVDNDTKTGATPNEYVEKLTIQVNDIDTDSATNTLDIKIIDDTPTANPDTNSIQEDTASITSNVLTNDTKGADGANVSGVKKGNDTSTDATSNVATDVDGDYGKVKINADGSYTYILDNTNTNVQALGANDTLTETFTYTIKDNDGDTSTTTLTITINGKDDGVELTTPTQTVYESGLSGGSEPTSNKHIVNNSFTLKALDGLKDIVVGGTTLTKAQVEALNATTGKQTIDTGEGTLELNNYSKASDGTITISYKYTLKASQTHTKPTNDTEIIDNISITVNDTDSDTTTQNLSIKIIDDTPTAKENTTSLSIEEGGETYTSTVETNLLKNDTLGADGATVTSIKYTNESGDLVTGNVAQNDQFTIFNTQHGSLHVKKDGSWKFTSDNSVDNTTNPATEETFTYTITDGDGDTSSANQSITITDTNPAVVPTNGSVDEGDLATIGSHNPKASTATTQDLNIIKDHDNISDVVFTNATITTLNALNLTSGGTALAYTLTNSNHTLTAKAGSESVFTVELTNPTDSTGTSQAYTFTLLKPIDHTAPSSGQDENTQNLTFKFDLKDTDSTVNSSFQVGIKDDVPTASSEPALTVVEGQVALTGMVNLLANDVKGADGLKEANKIAGFKYKDTNGAEQTGTLGSEVNTKYGKLTVNADGSWSYTSNQSNVHKTTDTNYNATNDTLADTFTYIIEDYDGDKSEATQTIHVKDGADPTIDNTKNTLVKVYEGDSKVTFNGTSNYNESSSNANKDTTLKPTHKLDFTQGTDKAGITSFTFDTQTKTITEDGSATITSTTKGALKVHYDGTWEYTPPATYTHDSGNGVNNFQETFTYKVTDIDGDEVSGGGSQTIQVDDTLANFETINPQTLDEKYLPTGTAPDNAQLTQTGNIGIDVSRLSGTHDVKFNTTQSDTTLSDAAFSSLAQKISYSVSTDGHTLTLYTGGDASATANHVMVVTILNPTTATPTYSAKLLKPLDHKGALTEPLNSGKLKFDFDITLSDDDGDTDGGKLIINVTDDHIVGGTQTLVTDEDTVKIMTTNADATQGNTSINQPPTHGSASIESDGKLKYTPNANYSGTDTLKYTTTLDNGDSQEITVNIDVKPLAENKLKTDVNGDTNADLTLVGSVGSQTDNTSVTTYKLATVYNDEDTNVDLKMPDPSKLLLDTSTAKNLGGIESVTEATISGIPSGASITYTDSSNATQTISNITTGNTTLTLANLKVGTDGYFDYTMSNLPANSSTDFTIKYSFTVTDTATISSGDVSDTQKFEITQFVDMLGVADIDGTKLVLTAQTANENTAILLSDIITKTGLFIDNDGSEAHAFKISGLPLDVTTTAGSFATDGATKTLTITEAQLSTATIKFPHSDGAFNIKVTAISQENDHNDTKGANPTKEDMDTHKIDNVDNSTHNDGTSYGQGYAQISKNVTLTINPDAKDTVFNVANKETPEDTAIGLNIDFTNPDTYGTTEQVTEVTISGIPSGAKLYKADDIVITSYTFTVGDGTGGTYTLADIKGLKILPPAHSSKDFTLTLSATVKEGAATNTITKTQIIKVTPVAEVISAPVSDTDGNGTADLTMTGGYDFTTNSVNATEDTFFNIGNNDGFNLKSNWNNEDSSEETFAHLTFGKDSSGTFTPIAGATFTYNDGSLKTPTDTGSGVDIPVAYLNTVQVKPPLNESGTFKIKVQAKTIDYDEDTNVATSPAISGESFLTFTVKGVADTPTVAVKPAQGDEDAGRVDGNDTTSAPTTFDLTKAIDLSITPSSDDKSETFNVKIDEIPNGAEIFYDGVKQTITSGTLIINNFDSSKPLKFIPVHNDGTDVTLKVSAQSVDGSNTSAYSTPLNLNIKIKPIADMVVNDEFKKLDVNGATNASGKYNDVTNEADNDNTNNNKILLNKIYKTPNLIAPYDNDTAPAPEVATFVITGLDAKFDVEGASFLGGSGANRQWVATLEDLKATNKVYIKTQKHFAGEINFVIDAVTTETAGDSEKHAEKNVKIFVKPDAADGTLENLSVTQKEDAWVKLTFLDKFNDKDGGDLIDGKESLSKVWLLKSHLAQLELSSDGTDASKIDINTLTLDTTGNYVQVDLNGVHVKAKEGGTYHHKDSSYNIGVKYEVKDEVKVGTAVLDSATTTKTATYTVNVEAVTDQPTVTPTPSPLSDETIDTTDGNTSNDTFTKTISINSPDTDGSESFTRIEVTGVPEGIGIVGGVYGGDKWYIDIDPDQVISSANSANLSYILTFEVIGGFSNVANQTITITAFNKDRVGGSVETSEMSASATFKLSLNGGSGGVTTELIDSFATTTKAIDEDSPDGFALQDVVNASFKTGKSAPFTFVLYDLPEDAEITGINGVNPIKQGNVWIINGSGDTAAINNVLDNVKIKMPPNYSTNDDTINTGSDGKLPFKVQLTAYGANGKTEKTAKEPVDVTVNPKTDFMDFNGTTTAVTTDEDVVVDIVVDFANEKDGNYQEIVDGKVYFQVDENYTGTSPNSGALKDSSGNPLIAVTDPAGLPAGTYYALDVGTTPSSSSITVKYTPAENEDGNVSIKTFVKHKETHNISGHDSGEKTSSMTTNITVNKAPDPLKIEATHAEVVENEDNPSGIELKYTVSEIDINGGDELASVLVKNIPQNYIIYYYDGSEAKIANNIGADNPSDPNSNNSWSVPAQANGSPSQIYLKAPKNVSSVVDNIELIAVTTDNLLSDPATIKVTIKPIADDVTLSPTATFGKEYTWINLNLNAVMEDNDGSETLTLELNGTTPLDNTALFKVGNNYINATFDTTTQTYKIEGIPADEANDLQILYHDYEGTLNIKATTVDTLIDGGTTHTDTLATAVEKTMELKISDSFSIDVSGETQNMTIMTEDLTIPIIGSAQTDTIVFKPDSASTAAVDFADIADEIRNVEVIDLSFGNATITNLTIADVKKMTDSNNTLKIDGDSGDSIKLDSGWGSGTDSGTYTTYTDGVATLEIDKNITIL